MNFHRKIKVAVIGASGYTGAELVRMLIGHKKVQICYLIADSNAGKPMGQIYPHLRNCALPDLIGITHVNWDEVDLAFCCLPHGTTQAVVKTLPRSLKIIDLSADFRLFNLDEYQKWYGREHVASDLQESAVYGLSELFREPLKSATLVACPGCYPTSALLPLAPLLKTHLIENDSIIIDSKSGVSGAGRAAKQGGLFCEVNEGLKAYNVCEHRHMPEIEQVLSVTANAKVRVHFTPQLVPMSRGILSTIYVRLTKDVGVDGLRNALHDYYHRESFVHILPDGQLPSTRDVSGTNNCHIGVVSGRTSSSVVIVSVIDNLIKGASGQALQNMNIMLGFPEEMGLDYVPLFP